MDSNIAAMLYGAAVALLAVSIGLITAILNERRIAKREAQDPQVAEPGHTPRFFAPEGMTSRPWPVDPDNPPFYAIAIDDGGDAAKCDCHGHPFADGDQALHWPRPTVVLCKETYESADIDL